MPSIIIIVNLASQFVPQVVYTKSDRERGRKEEGGRRGEGEGVGRLWIIIIVNLASSILPCYAHLLQRGHNSI